MLKKRIIVCLDVRDGKVTKGIKFQNNVDIGDPVALAEKYYQDGVDELVFYDITASSEERKTMLDVVQKVAERIFIPFAVGGGVRSVHDMHALLHCGAEKVSVNSFAVENPDIIEEGARRFGNQCVVLGVDALADPSMPSGYRVVVRGGRQKTEKDVLQWVKEAQERGAGEIVLNSIDADGMRDGYECTLTRKVADALSIPVVASGGAGTPAHLVQVLNAGGAHAALVASMVHYKTYSIAEIKQHLHEHGVPVRV